MVRCSRLAEALHRARFAESLLRPARGQRRQPARDPRLGWVEPERSPDGRALYARCRPEGALAQRRREGGGMSAAGSVGKWLIYITEEGHWPINYAGADESESK